MKKVFFILGTLLLSLSTYAAMNVNKIDPPFWYTGMQNPELQLMVYGEGIGNATVSVNYPGVSLSSTVKLESNNYLLVYLRLDKNVKPGKMPLTFTQGKKKFVKEYELKERAKKGCEHKGFDASDALYLLMPDRFANGNPDNDQRNSSRKKPQFPYREQPPEKYLQKTECEQCPRSYEICYESGYCGFGGVLYLISPLPIQSLAASSYTTPNWPGAMPCNFSSETIR